MGSLESNAKLPLRIAVLECDTPLDKTRTKFGGYGGVFKQLLDRSADALGSPGLSSEQGLDLRYFDVRNDDKTYPKLEEIDAILLTGSRYDSFADEPWINKLVEYTKEALQHERVRTIGVCFGHQIVGRALGQKVGRGDKGWEVSVLPVNLTDKGQHLFNISGGPLKIYQMHKDIVYGYPQGVEELGSSGICQNQGMYDKGVLITVQGHPEFTREIVDEIIRNRHALGIFDDAQFEDALKRLEDHDDGVIIGQAFLRFLLED